MVNAFPYTRFLIFVYGIFMCLKLQAQFYHQPINYQFSLLTKRMLAQPDSRLHSSMEPYIPFFSEKYDFVSDTHRLFKYIIDDRALDKVFVKHLIEVKSKEPLFKLRIDPVLNIELGRDTEDTISRQLSTNTRGFMISASIGNDFYFESTFAETQSYFPNYVSNFSKGSQVIPGQGRWKVFKKTGYDYAYSSGIISYQAGKHVNIQVGHGKQNVGDGYRSLLLSDNAFSYPYARITQQWFNGKLQYTNIYAALMNLDSASKRTPPNTERLFQKKAAAFQYLSLNVSKRIHVGLFQGMIWQAANRNNAPQLEWQYFNPLIFSNLGFYGLNNKNNILIGSTIKIKPIKNVVVYGQFMADDLSDAQGLGNGIGYQVGANYFDVLGIKNLFLQAEYNSVQGSAYNNPLSAESNQSYSHYNQNLAFTPNNGSEFLAIVDYKYKRFFFNSRFQFQQSNTNKLIASSRSIIVPTLGYLINPAYNLNVSVGVLSRTQNFDNFSKLNEASHYIYFGIRTSLFNTYYDF